MLQAMEFIFVRYGVIPLWALWERSPYLRHLEELKRREQDRMETIHRQQQEGLAKILAHAYAQCPYYREVFDRAGFKPERYATDFTKIPILSKDDIRKNKEGMVARNIPGKKLIPKKTSGSTGVSLELYMDRDCSEWRRAAAIFRNSWTGWQLGQRTAALWGNPPNKAGWRAFLRNLVIKRCIFLDTLEMDEKTMHDFCRWLNRHQPVIMIGHAYSLYFLARFIEMNNIPVPFHLKGIVSTAMILYPWQRVTIEAVFRCKVFDRYGCEEVSLIASECEHHQGMHVNTDSLIVEFLKDGRPARPGEEAAVVVTDFINYGMPVIRYKIGDMAVYTDQPCSCGRAQPLIEKVTGRDADFVLTPRGKIISGISLTENFSLKIAGIVQMQIVQHAIDRLSIRIVRDQSFGEASERRLRELSASLFGGEMQCRYEYVTVIPQEKSGKYRFVISELSPPEEAMR